jgi:hypothetical protein
MPDPLLNLRLQVLLACRHQQGTWLDAAAIQRTLASGGLTMTKVQVERHATFLADRDMLDACEGRWCFPVDEAPTPQDDQKQAAAERKAHLRSALLAILATPNGPRDAAAIGKAFKESEAAIANHLRPLVKDGLVDRLTDVVPWRYRLTSQGHAAVPVQAVP